MRLFVSFPETLVDRPMIYEIVKRFDVVPNIRRANVEAHSGWVILELSGDAGPARRDHRVPRRARLHGQHAWKATSSRDDPATTSSRPKRSRRAAGDAGGGRGRDRRGREREAPGRVIGSVGRLLDAWGRVDDVAVAAAEAAVAGR